jgi:hypothetical protein
MHPGSAFARPPNAASRHENDPPIFSDDVGPLLAQAEALRDRQPLDDAMRALYIEAASRALTGQAALKLF